MSPVLLLYLYITYTNLIKFGEQIKGDDDKDEEEKVRCATIWWAEENHG